MTRHWHTTSRGAHGPIKDAGVGREMLFAVAIADLIIAGLRTSGTEVVSRLWLEKLANAEVALILIRIGQSQSSRGGL